MSSTWILLLTIFNLLVLVSFAMTVFLRVKEKREDQRLAKGLQLLQNKISILQDLSDRTDLQVQKMIHVIEKKSEELRAQVIHSESVKAELDSMHTACQKTTRELGHMATPQITRDQQRTSLQVQAAKLANQGMTKEQILQKVDLNPAEIDLIIKLNKNKLQFAEELLPSWIETEDELKAKLNSLDSDLVDFQKNLQEQKEKIIKQKMATSATLNAFEPAKNDLSAQAALQKEFSDSKAKVNVKAEIVTVAPDSLKKYGTVSPYVFKKIQSQKN